MSHLSYLFLVLFFLWIPTLVVWSIKFKLLRKYKFVISLIVFVSFLVGGYWDIYGVAHKIWRFYPETTLGVFFKGVPLEEYFFVASAALALASITISFTQKR